VERCRDMFRAQQGAALVFTDQDFVELLGVDEMQRSVALEAMCRAKFRALMA